MIRENPANRIAEALTGRDYLSHTQVSTFQSCPLRWHFQYVERLPHEQVSASLLFGTAIHRAVEEHFRRRLAGVSPATVEDLLTVFDEAWAEGATAPIEFGRGEDLASQRERGAGVLAAFLGSAAADPDGQILGIEEEVRVTYLPEVPDLLARIDLIIGTREALIIRDFKTARGRWSADKVIGAAPQLVLYGDLCGSLHEVPGELRTRLEFCVLTKAKDPSVEIHPVEVDRRNLARTRSIIRRVWQAMQGGVVYPNPSPMNCASCPFRQACRDWEG